MRWLRVSHLMGAVAIVALALWLLLVVPGGFLLVHPTIGIAACAFALWGRSDPARWIDAWLFPLVLGLAVAGEYHASRLAYHTLGELEQGACRLAIAGNVLATLLLVFRRRRHAYIVLALIFLAIVPQQLVLLHRWNRLDREAQAIIARIQRARATTGRFPADLSGHEFLAPELAGNLDYALDDQFGYRLSYWIGARSTSHVYSPARGWTYYPD